MRCCIAFVAVLLSAIAVDGQSRVEVENAAVATSSPAATRIALRTLSSGGTAADASVAAALVLASEGGGACGLGGGGVVLYYERTSGVTRALSFPTGTTNALNLEQRNGSAVVEGEVPGLIAGLSELSSRHGRIEWNQLVSMAATYAATLGRARLSKTLSRMTESGESFYSGALGEDLARQARLAGVGVTPRDLEKYEARWVAPIRIDYGPYEVFSLLPPEGGGAAFAETLSLMAGFDLSVRVESPEFVHVLVEAVRLALEDDATLIRARAAGGRMPYIELLEASRLDRLRAGINPSRASSPEASEVVVREAGGSSFTIVDRDLNLAVGVLSGCSCTEPIELELGFDICAADTELARDPVLLPLIIFEEGRPWVAISGNGGFSDLPATIQMLFGLSRGLELDTVTRWPRVAWDPEHGRLYFENSPASEKLIGALNRAGHPMAARESIGDFNIVRWKENGMEVLSDLRGRGAAGGY